jgi:hypothetical protein
MDGFATSDRSIRCKRLKTSEEPSFAEQIACDEAYIAAQIHICLHSNRDRKRRGSGFQGCPLQIAIVEDAEIGRLQTGNKVTFIRKHERWGGHQSHWNTYRGWGSSEERNATH